MMTNSVEVENNWQIIKKNENYLPFSTKWTVIGNAIKLFSMRRSFLVQKFNYSFVLIKRLSIQMCIFITKVMKAL